jgi:hypothetical protein
MMLNEGWNLMPVICGDDVSCVDMFTALGDDLVVAKEIAGTEVYWPGEEVTTLEHLNSGKSYMVKMDAAGSITFPEANNSAENVSESIKKFKSKGYEECVPTGNSHLISIPSEVLLNSPEPFMEGDIIGGFVGFNPELYCGTAEITDLNQNYTLVLFGNDSTTSEQDGMNDGELFFLTVYRPSWDQTLPLIVEWDESFPNNELYAHEGMSRISYVSIWTGVEENAASRISVYPNPAKDQITIQGIENMDCTIEVVDIKGQQILSIGKYNVDAIDVSMLEQGIYFIRISNEDFNVVRKLVIK